MRKIIDEWQIHQYIVLVLDKDIWGHASIQLFLDKWTKI